jgi:acetyl-CoA carboxylase biotin carboxyl carrier protein
MDLSKIKDLKDLQAILDLMGRYGLVELEIEGDGQKVRLRKADPSGQREIVSFAAPFPMAPIHGLGGSAAAPASASAPQAAAPPPSPHKDVTSPMVGSFYRAPSPEAEPYVREGDVVGPDTILCIIEAMKVMNEIPAGISGIVREILVKNGESVEFGQPLFRVETE